MMFHGPDPELARLLIPQPQPNPKARPLSLFRLFARSCAAVTLRSSGEAQANPTVAAPDDRQA